MTEREKLIKYLKWMVEFHEDVDYLNHLAETILKLYDNKGDE